MRDGEETSDAKSTFAALTHLKRLANHPLLAYRPADYEFASVVEEQVRCIASIGAAFVCHECIGQEMWDRCCLCHKDLSGAACPIFWPMRLLVKVMSMLSIETCVFLIFGRNFTLAKDSLVFSIGTALVSHIFEPRSLGLVCIEDSWPTYLLLKIRYCEGQLHSMIDAACVSNLFVLNAR